MNRCTFKSFLIIALSAALSTGALWRVAVDDASTSGQATQVVDSAPTFAGSVAKAFPTAEAGFARQRATSGS